MLNDIYNTRISDDFQTFEFESVGPKGRIRKVVEYVKVEGTNIYNLGVGDKDAKTGIIDDLVVTNNGDSKKVLTTVAATMYSFTNEHPDAIITATGSTDARTRLYQ